MRENRQHVAPVMTLDEATEVVKKSRTADSISAIVPGVVCVAILSLFILGYTGNLTAEQYVGSALVVLLTSLCLVGHYMQYKLARPYVFEAHKVYWSAITSEDASPPSAKP